MFDTGIYLQVLHNLWAKGTWASSITGESNFLAHHFQPLISILAPLTAFANRSLTLFSVSAVCTFFTALQVTTYARKICTLNSTWIAAFTAAIWLHPSIANRVYHGFVPEVLALPLYTFVGIQLLKPSLALGRHTTSAVLLALVLAGLCKENLWLNNIWFCILFAWKSNHQRRVWFLSAAAFLGIFIFLFYYWMPAHSVLPNYYGMRYFVDPSAAGSGVGTIVHSLIGNVFSLTSIKTILLTIAAPLLFLPFIFCNIATVAALPTIAMILCTRSFQHVIENHYLLPALPLLWLSAVTNVARIGPLAVSMRKQRYVALGLVLVPLCILLFSENGILGSLARSTRSERLPYIRADAQTIAAQLYNDSYVLAEGTIQPTLPTLQRVKDILSFSGNPNPVNERDHELVTDVITFTAYNDIELCQNLLRSDELPSNLDVERTVATCRWLTNTAKTTIPYPNSGLYHLRIERR